MANFNTGGGSAGDFDDSFNEAMGYSGGSNDQNDGGGGGGRGGSGAEVDVNMGIAGRGADRQDSLMNQLNEVSNVFDQMDNILNTGTNFNRPVTVLNAQNEMRGFDPRGGRYGADDTAFFAGAIGRPDLAFQITPPDQDNSVFRSIERGVTKALNAVHERFGTSINREYAILPSEKYIGKITEDYGFTDFIGNVLGTITPGGARVDRYRSEELTKTGRGTRQFGEAKAFYGSIDTRYAVTPEKEQEMLAEQRRAQEERRKYGDDQPPQPISTVAGVTGTVARPRSAILGSLMGDLTSPMYNIAAPYVGDALDAVNPFSYFGGGSATNAFNFVKGGPVQKAQMGGVQENIEGPVGFVGGPPEQMTEAETVADDVPVEVAEGSYVLNAAAVEYMGSADVKKMILSALQELKTQGVDKAQNIDTVELDTQVSLLVSKGEVLIPPAVAQVIGYDRLEKINKRGLKETEKRVQENGQSPEAEALDQQPANPSEGMTMFDGGVAHRLQNDLAYLYGSGSDRVNEAILKAREKNPEGFAQVQEKNTDRKIEALNRIQFETDEIINKSPEPLRKFDSYLIEQAPYFLQIAYGTEDRDQVPLAKAGDFYSVPEDVMGLASHDRTRAYYPGKPEEFRDTTYLHETGHALYPYDLSRVGRSLASVAKTFGLPYVPADEPDDENAVTTLDLYRSLVNGNEAEIKQAVGYLMYQHREIPGTPLLTEEGSIDSLKESTVRYVSDIMDKSEKNKMSDKERKSLADDMERVFDEQRDKIQKYAREYEISRAGR